MNQEKPKAPKLRFKEFNSSLKKIKLKDVSILITKGTTPTTIGQKFIRNGINFIKVENISDNNEINIIDTPKISTDTNNTLRRSQLLENDILLSIAGTLGRTAIINSSHLPANTNQALSIIRLDPQYSTSFIYYYLNSIKMKRYTYSMLSIGAQPNLSLDQVSNFTINLPEIDEQNKISEFLITIDRYIKNLKSQKEELEKYKKGMMQKIFSQQIRFKDENGNSFPDWEYKDLNNISKIIKGKQLNKSSLETNYKNGLFAVINGGTLPSGYTVDFNTPKNTITISEGGNSCGYVNLIKENFWCGGHCYKITEIDTNCDVNYLFNYLKFTQQAIMKLRVGSGLPNIQRKDIEKISIPIPSNSEQNKISKFLNEINKKIEINESRINLAVEWKKGLMQQMFL